MKICVVGDVHFTQHSFVAAMGNKYPLRLENHIASLNWVEDLAEKENCDMMLYLGDFFDRPNINEVETTALGEVKWNKLTHYFLVGNHDSGVKSLEYNIVNALYNIPNSVKTFIINQPTSLQFNPTTKALLLPYIVEDDRKPLAEYIKDTKADCENLVVFSHNDLKNVQYGNMLSKKGFDIDEITSLCKKFINGHIHNHFEVNKCILNLGILTGQNFNEDGSTYDHKVMILDTDNLNDYKYFINPYAFNFYKLEINSLDDLKIFDTLKTNAVVSIKAKQELVDKVKDKIKSTSNIIASKLVVIVDNIEVESVKQINNVNHISQFVNFVLDSLGNTELVNEELTNIVGE